MIVLVSYHLVLHRLIKYDIWLSCTPIIPWCLGDAIIYCSWLIVGVSRSLQLHNISIWLVCDTRTQLWPRCIKLWCQSSSSRSTYGSAWTQFTRWRASSNILFTRIDFSGPWTSAFSSKLVDYKLQARNIFVFFSQSYSLCINLVIFILDFVLKLLILQL